MRTKHIVSFAALAALLAFTGHRGASACPFCEAPSQTFAEQVSQSDGVCLVQWVSAKPVKDQDPGETTYEVVQCLKSPNNSVKKGDKIKLARFRAGKKGELILLMGSKAGKGDAVEWGSPIEITEAGYQYIAQAPSPETPVEKRLPYYLKFLEFPDTLVSTDAYGEFANAPYKDIAAIAPVMPREKIRGWIASKDTLQTRLGLYGMLLGLCGNEEDAKLLGEKIAPNPGTGFRLGIDGMMSGYLMLAGDKGLDNIDKWKFKPEAKAEFSEIYAAMQALRFMWQYAGGKIDNERLMQSMRLLLDRPEFTDLVIADLARMGDWSVQDKLMSLYGKGDYNIPAVKRAIVKYMLASTKAKPDANAKTDPAKSGKLHVEELRKKDPQTVREAERFL